MFDAEDAEGAEVVKRTLPRRRVQSRPNGFMDVYRVNISPIVSK